MYRFRERERESFTATRLPKCLAMRWTANLMPNGGAMLVFFVKLEREREEGGKDEKRRDSTFVGFMVFC